MASVQDQRPLLPRGQGSAESKRLQVRYLPANRVVLPPGPRHSAVSLACQGCQQRKVKCDGVRPTCRTCRVKGHRCKYEFEAGLTRTEGLRKKQKVLQQNADSFHALYSFLQNRNVEDANELFTQIRNGASLESVLLHVKNGLPMSPCSSSSSSSSSDTLSAIAPAGSGAIWGEHVSRVESWLEDELLSAASFHITSQALREGVECFIVYVGTMFPVLTREEASALMQIYEEPISESEDDQFSREQIGRKKVVCGELLAFCATGLQYDRNRLPGGSASRCTPFYQKARLFLDHVIENDQLRAMRMCLCLGMYNIMAKSTLAVAYTDWGIYLGASNGLAQDRRPYQLPIEDHVKYTKVFRALITLRSWVTATLGHIPGVEITRYIYGIREELSVRSVQQADTTTRNVIDELQRNMACITILKADILSKTTKIAALSMEVLIQMRKDLHQWYTGLPDYMHLESLVKHPEVSPDQRRVTFYMHLFYMSAILLKARAVISRQESDEKFYEVGERRTAVLDGLDAARVSGRLLGLIFSEGAVVRTCWLLIYQSYITFLTLIYSMVKHAQYDSAEAIQSQDMMLANNCMDVLKLCATKDRIGHSFHKKLQGIKTMVTEQKFIVGDFAHPPTRADEDQQQSPHEGPWLFIPNENDTKAKLVIKEILQVLCFPLNRQKNDMGEGELPYPMIAESFGTTDNNFACHVASPFSMDEKDVPMDLFPRDGYDEDSNDAVLKNVRAREDAGMLLGGEVPHGWSRSAFAGQNQEGSG